MIKISPLTAEEQERVIDTWHERVKAAPSKWQKITHQCGCVKVRYIGLESTGDGFVLNEDRKKELENGLCPVCAGTAYPRLHREPYKTGDDCIDYLSHARRYGLITSAYERFHLYGEQN